MFFSLRKFSQVAILALTLAFVVAQSGCVYFNTFYNANKSFKSAEKDRIESMEKGTLRINTGKYKRAIDKASIILEKHPDSKYYDDALFMIGVSYFWIKEYFRSERKFREILANFEDSKFAVESRLYLAKCKLALNERAEAITVFQDLLGTVKDDEMRTEAAFAVGDFFYEQGDHHQAEEYYQLVRDSLGDETGRRKALLKIADSRFESFQLRQALDLYLESLEKSPLLEEEYHAKFRAGECNFLLQEIEDAMDFYRDLADNSDFYDSIGPIRLQIARGFELDNDILLAEEEYRDITVEASHTAASGAAFYNLGLIYQFDYEDYPKALDYYNQAKAKGRNLNPFYEESVKRAADIGRLTRFSVKTELDTSATQQQIDDASQAQLRLGELYMVEIDQPDSAVEAFRYAVDSLPTGYYTPRALLSLALIHRDEFDDTAAFDSLTDKFLKDYSRTDFYPELLEVLDSRGTSMDTGYAESYFMRAENFLIEEENLDSALYYYQIVVDSFPRSVLQPKARFTVIWLKEQYLNPGDDSTLIFAYAHLADSFPDTEYGKMAAQLAYNEPAAPSRIVRAETPDKETADTALTDTLSEDTTEADPLAIDTNLSPELRYYVGPDGQELRDAPSNPTTLEVIEFIYPSSARGMSDQFDLYFQVQLDFDGVVLEYVLMNPSPYPQLNQVVSEQVANFLFNPGKFDDRGLGDGWFVHKYRVLKPDYLR